MNVIPMEWLSSSAVSVFMNNKEHLKYSKDKSESSKSNEWAVRDSGVLCTTVKPLNSNFHFSKYFFVDFSLQQTES